MSTLIKTIPERKPRALLRHAHTLFDVKDVPAHVQRHNRKQWVRAVVALEDRWLLAVPQGRSPQ